MICVKSSRQGEVCSPVHQHRCALGDSSFFALKWMFSFSLLELASPLHPNRSQSHCVMSPCVPKPAKLAPGVLVLTLMSVLMLSVLLQTFYLLLSWPSGMECASHSAPGILLPEQSPSRGNCPSAPFLQDSALNLPLHFWKQPLLLAFFLSVWMLP